MRSIVILFLSLTSSTIINAQTCPSPPSSPDFNKYTYNGTWYEIAKAQTWGGAIFESSCVCTEIVVTPSNDGVATDKSVLNSCRDKTPSGSFLNATGTLVNQRTPGWWEEEFIPGLPTVNYTVIALGDDYSIEFDCGETLFGPNYCIHILSRTPEMDPSLLAKLIDFANNTLALNIFNLPYNMTKQEGCW